MKKYYPKIEESVCMIPCSFIENNQSMMIGSDACCECSNNIEHGYDGKNKFWMNCKKITLSHRKEKLEKLD